MMFILNNMLGRSALETVKVLGLAPLFGKEGLGEILLQKHFIAISMSYCFVKSPQSPFSKGGSQKQNTFTASLACFLC